jgi:hypothetical protein
MKSLNSSVLYVDDPITITVIIQRDKSNIANPHTRFNRELSGRTIVRHLCQFDDVQLTTPPYSQVAHGK